MISRLQWANLSVPRCSKNLMIICVNNLDDEKMMTITDSQTCHHYDLSCMY